MSFLRFLAPLATSLLESDLPGIATPGNFHLRIFRPSDGFFFQQRFACLISYKHHLWGSKSNLWLFSTELAPRIPEKVHPKRQPSSGYANRRAHREPKSSATDLLQIHISLSSNKLNSTSPATVDASLTWPIASNRPGRRAHQQPNRRNPIRR